MSSNLHLAVRTSPEGSPPDCLFFVDELYLTDASPTRELDDEGICEGIYHAHPGELVVVRVPKGTTHALVWSNGCCAMVHPDTSLESAQEHYDFMAAFIQDGWLAIFKLTTEPGMHVCEYNPGTDRPWWSDKP